MKKEDGYYSLRSWSWAIDKNKRKIQYFVWYFVFWTLFKNENTLKFRWLGLLIDDRGVYYVEGLFCVRELKENGFILVFFN